MLNSQFPVSVTVPLPPVAATVGVCLAVAAFSLLLCLFAEPLAARLKLLDIPSQRKKHAYPTPLMGGLVMLGAVLPLCLIWALTVLPPEWQVPMVIWVAATAAMTLIGLADDRLQVSATMRLVLSAGVIALVANSSTLYNIRFLQFENPEFAFGFGNLPFSIVFTTVCLVGFANAVNMADGKNGLILGLSILWTVLLGIRSPLTMAPFYLMLLSAMAIMLVFNLRGRLFLGDGGSYGLATAIGLFAIMIYNQRGWHAGRNISAEELILLFFVPVADFFRVVVMRIAKGKSPFSPDRGHLHHILLDRFAWPFSLFIYYGLTLIPVCLIWALDRMPENYVS